MVGEAAVMRGRARQWVRGAVAVALMASIGQLTTAGTAHADAPPATTGTIHAAHPLGAPPRGLVGASVEMRGTRFGRLHARGRNPGPPTRTPPRRHIPGSR